MDTGTFDGCNQLIKLAIHILSIIGNSAGCEHLFSAMGLIHTKLRNRLGPQKVRDMAILRAELHRSHLRQGLTRPRSHKWKFRNMEASEGDDKKQEAADLDVDEDDEGPADTRSVAQSLIKEAEEDDNDLGAELFDEELPDASDLVVESTRNRHIICFFGAAPLVPLSQLFIYPDNYNSAPEGRVRKGFNMFWTGSVANLTRELEVYDLINSNSLKENYTRASGAKTAPIVVD
ncbi:hypothetical protein M422DRAFT_67959 [Sphaerobolus stellatus SS14]|uniref:HAT C-terminal dimerisation domain-containing protein n=1 Tax=Sphaerobolus stellatus (strain SS14) TaxID=990650 RepID=A0A0C9UIK7_SPHS4|nr:hypothetical protein M422DRAFT_67959 [Sphaerobolus stellatus SS14]